MANPVSFISLGPGDPELITLKSFHALENSEIIFCPATVTKNGTVASRAADLMEKLGFKDKLRTFLLPMRNDRKAALEAYDGLIGEIMKIYSSGAKIAVAVEGDAGIYASIHYVLESLHENGLPVEQLPGIPSFIASASASLLHLVSGDRRLVIVPGNVSAEEIEKYISENCSLVIMKLSRCAESVKSYIRSHPGQHYIYVENISTDKEKIITSAEEIMSDDMTFPYFSLMIIQ